MATTYILYNPSAGNGESKQAVEALSQEYDNAAIINMCRMTSYETFFSGLEENDTVILCGGDGTINHFINGTVNLEVKNRIYYFPMGTGNDFAHDIGYEKNSPPNFLINEYLEDLPTVTVNGKTFKFLNNVGFGIDGYCTEVGDKLREKNRIEKTNKPINYTAIAIKGLLFYFKPRNAIVTIDGVKREYKKVWLAPSMKGKFYGGGMMAAPNQDRLSKDGKLSVMMYHGSGALRALIMFPSIFKGEHVKYKKYVTVLTGNEITIEFDRPTPLQIDGETMLGITSYSVSSKPRK